MESTNRMYYEFAHLWPLIRPAPDYKNEASYWLKTLRKKLGPGRHNILELGVGGGCNLSFLTNDFNATAVDLSAEMLAQCHKLNPTVELHQGDMRSIRLPKKFDAVIVHDAIDYMLSENDLSQVFATAIAHLKPGGVFITAPDNFRDTFISPRVEHEMSSNNTVNLTHIEYYHDPDPSDTTIEVIMFYMIKTKDGLKIEQDRHIFGLFPVQTWLDLMGKAGFAVEKHPYPVHEDGREAFLLVGAL